MDALKSQLPSALAKQTRYARLGPHQVPALLAHPDWAMPAPTLIWMHGRTVTKELDNGRYLRLIRAGIACCALDLPGHGERFIEDWHHPRKTLEALTQMVGEVDGVVAALGGKEFGGVFDTARLALGGMSAGGMVTLRRLCDPHSFVCAAVEGTAGNLAMLYSPAMNPQRARLGGYTDEAIAAVDPLPRVKAGQWKPLPLLLLHSETDRIVPLRCVTTFTDELKEQYAAKGADTALVQLHTWPQTGAPDEHNGFGRVANDAKTLHVDFLTRYLLGRV